MFTSSFSVLAEDETKNVYFGDLHVHSSLSFDSYIFGNRLSLDQSYRIAKGEAFENVEGEIMQLRTPLDFAAITDHSESFGIHEGCDDEEATLSTLIMCRRLESPDLLFFLQLRANGAKRPPENPMLDAAGGDHEKLHKFAKMTWEKIINVNNKHNEPGKFTTFHAYEYSPTLPDIGKHHRNVIFRNNSVPDHAISMFHAATEIDLWKQLNDLCLGSCEFITIPHNSNRSWGLAFANVTIDGDRYDLDAWKLRDRFEPLVELFQIKGNSECSIGFGTTDEECNFEQYLPRCEPDQETGCIHPTSMARDGLKLGLEYQEKLGFNPMDFGFIGSTDTHNSNPGDTEEYDYTGSTGVFTAPAKTRLEGARINRNPGGLAAIWAEENTRDALFDSMQRKEVYATSGTRIKLKFSLSFQSQQGTHPMGSTVQALEGNLPEFRILAQKDPLEAPLHKVQLIKGWTNNGVALERVLDLYCSESCTDEIFKVNLETCEIDQNQGEEEITVSWTDETYKPEQNAFYYVRVLQVPTCRWSTYDSLALGIQPPEDFPTTISEMAWSSPIWIESVDE